VRARTGRVLSRGGGLVTEIACRSLDIGEMLDGGRINDRPPRFNASPEGLRKRIRGLAGRRVMRFADEALEKAGAFDHRCGPSVTRQNSLTTLERRESDALRLLRDQLARVGIR